MRTKIKCPHCGEGLRKLYYRMDVGRKPVTPWGFFCDKCYSLYYTGDKVPELTDRILLHYVEIHGDVVGVSKGTHVNICPGFCSCPYLPQEPVG